MAVPFSGLDKVIEQRAHTGTGIGFASEIKNTSKNSQEGEWLKKVSLKDLVKYGLIPEFIGRLPVLTCLEELSEDALVQILRAPKNSLTKTIFSIIWNG